MLEADSSCTRCRRMGESRGITPMAGLVEMAAAGRAGRRGARSALMSGAEVVAAPMMALEGRLLALSTAIAFLEIWPFEQSSR